VENRYEEALQRHALLIAATKSIADLRAERGAFDSEEEFHAFWRTQAIGSTKAARQPADENRQA
jgi:hypothetical protein